MKAIAQRWHKGFWRLRGLKRLMATKADSCIPENLIDPWVKKTAQVMRTGMRGFPSGPEAKKPQQQAGYMCATFPLLPTQFILAKRSGPYMDQTTSPHQVLFWHHRQCSQNSGVDRSVRICTGSHHQKEAQLGCQPLHNSTNFECHSFRKNSVKSGAYRSGHQTGGARYA